jgi:hypothetical protein
MIRQLTHDNEQRIQRLTQATPSTRGGGGAIRLLDTHAPPVTGPVESGGLTAAERARRVALAKQHAHDNYARTVAWKREQHDQVRREEGMLDAVYWRYQRDVLGDRGVQNWEYAQLQNSRSGTSGGGGPAQRRDALEDEFARALHEYRIQNLHFHPQVSLPNPQVAPAHKQHLQQQQAPQTVQFANTATNVPAGPAPSSTADDDRVDTSTFSPPQHNGSFGPDETSTSILTSPAATAGSPARK